MTRIHARTSAQPPSERGGYAPWVAFTAILVLAMIAGLAAVLIALRPGGDDQPGGLGALHAPSLPAYKLPPIPPVRPR